MRKIFYILILALLVCVSATADNLLLNPGFEQATSNFLGTTFEDWEGTAGNQSIETGDVVSGSQAAHITAARFGSIYQELNMATATTGQQYELTIHYKLLSTTGTLSLNSYWESNTAGQLQHDEDSLWVTLPAGTGWQTFTTHTTRPIDGHKLHIAVAYTKNIEVLLDDFSLTESQSDAPWFTISPEKGGSAACNVGDSVLVNTYVIRQANLTAPVTLELVGQNANQWSLSRTTIPNTNTPDTVALYYRPTVAGNHRATLFVDCTAATTYSRTFSLSGAAANPAATPVITLSRSQLDTFTCAVGGYATDTLLVSASGCSDYVNITLVNNETPGAFTINNSQMPANIQDGVSIITFHPLTAGTYSATLYYATTGGETCTFVVTGYATGDNKGEQSDYASAFHFPATEPLAYLAEYFNDAAHNTPLALSGWQNVLISGQHGWWTLDQSNDENFYCAKATAFVSGMADTTSWDMWLITPALDYLNAPLTARVFSFRVRGDYLYDDMPTLLELYFIDATDTTDLYFEPIAAAIPRTADENGEWVDIVVDLSNQSAIPDTFYMGFRYTGLGGIAGAPTYYIDDVIWIGDQSDALPDASDITRPATKILLDGQLIILRNGVRYNATGQQL